MSAQPLDAIYWEEVDDGAGGTDYRLRETPLAFNYPVETRVIDGVEYGHAEDPKQGNFVVPTEDQVEENVQYGANGTEYTGTFQGGGDCDYPTEENVRKDVVYGDGEFVGTLEVGGGVIPIAGTWQEKMVGYVHTFHGDSASIMRGITSTNVFVIPDDHMIEMLSGVGGAGFVSSIDRVFRIRTAAYVFGGVAAHPQAGDRVMWGGQTWEVIRQANYAVPGYRNEYVLPCTRMS